MAVEYVAMFFLFLGGGGEGGRLVLNERNFEKGK